MPHEHIAQYDDKMLRYLQKNFGSLDNADRQEAVQTVIVEVLAYSADFVPTKGNWENYLYGAVRNVALQICKQRVREREFGWFQSLGGELEPDIVAAEVERRGRQRLLLSDILQEYALRCEQQNMQTQREVYERRLRGQDAKLIESAMGVTRDRIDQNLKRTRDWISDRMKQADVEKSVFQTFLRPTRDVPLLPDSVPADVPRNFHEVLMRVVNEVGALCPSDERLALFEQQPQADEFSDLRYHIEEVPCLLCQARRSL